MSAGGLRIATLGSVALDDLEMVERFESALAH
jgi:hypothetical protein